MKRAEVVRVGRADGRQEKMDMNVPVQVADPVREFFHSMLKILIICVFSLL